MTIEDTEVLALVRSMPCCWCPRRWRRQAEPHHLWAKGMGGGGQIDHLINLAPLCREHHQSHHDGNEPTHEQLLALVAAREGLLQRDIEAVMEFLRRVPNRPIAGRIKAELREMPAVARALAKTILQAREAA